MTMKMKPLEIKVIGDGENMKKKRIFINEIDITNYVQSINVSYAYERITVVDISFVAVDFHDLKQEAEE